MTIKEKIELIIKTEPIVKENYENNGGCFKNIIMPVIENSNDDGILYDLITMLSLQCSLYDAVLNNIAQFGSEELARKCKEDISRIASFNEE